MKRHVALALTICLLLFAFGCANAPETQTIDVMETSQEPPFSDILIDDKGHLIISMKDGTVFDAGVVKGEKGEKGDRGEPGEPGEDGIDGEDGRNGKDGEDGINGKDGRDGINGSDGSDGRDGSNGRTSSLESYATGTDFGCYPNSEFDWVVGDERSALYGETVHISSITAVLISKNSFENSCSDPALRLHDAFTPYVIRVTVSGYTDASNAGKQIAIGLINLNWASSTEFEYVTVIGSDGTFTASHDQNWPVVPDLLFHTIYRGVV